MLTIRRRMFVGLWLTIIISGLLAAQQTTKQRVTTGSTTRTEQISGTVVVVDGNTLLVRLDSGDLRTFTPPPSRRFVVDGRELSLSELRTGTKLTATITTTETSVTERTTTVGTGKVWYAAGPNVILTLPNGENRQYKVAEDYKFIVNGQPATAFDLKKGMTVSAQKIVEVPKVEFASNVSVTGTGPADVKPVSAAVPGTLKQEPAEVAGTPPARPSTSAAAAPEPTAAPPTPTAAASTPAAAPSTPAEPPSTPAPQAPAEEPARGNTVLLIGLVVLLGAGAIFLWRQSKNRSARAR